MADQPQVARNSSGYPALGPLYMKTTTPRSDETVLKGARDVFGALSQTSQFKVSLHLTTGGSATPDTNLNSWLSASGLTDKPIENAYYDFYCAEANLPASTLNTREIKGNFQGVTEKFAVDRTFQPISLTFYVDNDYRLIRLFEEWMNYINPLHGATALGGSQDKVEPSGYPVSTIGLGEGKNSNDFFRLRYPDEYRRIISITKFERDFREQPQLSGGVLGGNASVTYRMIDAFPTQISGVPLSYEGSTISKVQVQFDYSRFVYEMNPARRASPAGTKPSPKPMTPGERSRILNPTVTPLGGERNVFPA
jgi:hypothetical protein